MQWSKDRDRKKLPNHHSLIAYSCALLSPIRIRIELLLFLEICRMLRRNHYSTWQKRLSRLLRANWRVTSTCEELFYGLRLPHPIEKGKTTRERERTSSRWMVDVTHKTRAKALYKSNYCTVKPGTVRRLEYHKKSIGRSKSSWFSLALGRDLLRRNSLLVRLSLANLSTSSRS